MRVCLKFLISLGVIGWGLVVAWAAPQLESESAAAIQAIQQAPDPSAVVAAYANGVATDRNNPKLLDAYVGRMVDLGLPELAYHQAQSLTSLQSNNGLAWGVIAYVNARRGEMPDAVSAINLAGQFAPDNKFVARTAGEITAWYDLKADKTTLPDNAKDGLAKVRSLLEKDPAFTVAYETAKKAYQAQASPQPSQQQQQQQLEPGQVAPQNQQSHYASSNQVDQVAPLGYSGATASVPVYSSGYYYGPGYYPYYYNNFYYDWGPGWVQPAPWYWWRPVGFFSGYAFTPFSTVIVFDQHKSFRHHHGFHHRHNPFFQHHGKNFAFHHHNPALWHQGPHGKFFGTPARPNNAFVNWTRLNSRTVANVAARTTAPGIGSTAPLTLQPQSAIPRGAMAPATLTPRSLPTLTPPTARSTPSVAVQPHRRLPNLSGSTVPRADSPGSPTATAVVPGTSGRAIQRSVPTFATPAIRPTPPVTAPPQRSIATFSAPAVPRSFPTLPSRSGSLAVPSVPSRPGISSQSRMMVPPSIQRSWSGSGMPGTGLRATPVPRNSFAAPSFRAPSTPIPSMSAPRLAAPPSGGFRGSPALGSGGGFRGAPAMGGGGFHGGGGFRGGGFGGGGIHGGGGGRGR